MASVWGELKRRNVVKVAVAYAIVAWLLVQVIVSIEAPLRLPDWTDTLVIVFLLIGFIVAVFLAWAYELTPEGVKQSRSIPLTDSVARVTGRKLDFAIISLMALAITYLVVDNYVLIEEQSAEALTNETDTEPASSPVAEPLEVLPNSVAVLPFENLSPNEADAYFASGLHDEILNQLAKLRSLSVISRTSVLRYANSGLSIPEIARELNVGAIVEGSVRYANDRVRITTQLIDAATDEHLWSETYDREFEDIFAIESDIAVNIAGALKAELLPAEQIRVEDRPTASPAAYAVYLQALSVRYDALADIGESLELLNRATELDPNFALSYAAKANLYVNMYVNTTSSPSVEANDLDELEQLIRENAEKALSLDPGATLAHGALGQLNSQSWRWTEALQAYAQGNSLSGTEPWLNAYMGRTEEAVRVGQRGVELSPTSPGSYRSLGVTYALIGEHDAAIQTMRRSVELTPTDPLSHCYLGFMEVVRGNLTVALDELQIAEQLMASNRILPLLPELALAYARLGRSEDAQRLFAEIEEIADYRDIGAGTWALAHLGVGNLAQAIEWLEVAVNKAENHDTDAGFYALMFIKMNVLQEPILEQPDFVALRNQLSGD